MRKYNIFVIVIPLVTISGCSKYSDPVDTTTTQDPIAEFSYSYVGSMVTPAVITFQNASENADGYLWKFGDGTSSRAKHPSKIYDTMGTYAVKLIAINTSTGRSDNTRQNLIITPGKVLLQEVIIDDMSFTDTNGGDLDLTSGPDLFFTMIDFDGNVIFNDSSLRVDDVIPSMLPLNLQLNPEMEFLNSSWNKNYSIQVWDYDSTEDDLITEIKDFIKSLPKNYDTTYGDLIGTTNYFNIIQQVNANYPTTVSLQNTSGTMKVRLILRWQ